jgi:hypothetical protein
MARLLVHKTCWHIDHHGVKPSIELDFSHQNQCAADDSGDYRPLYANARARAG